MYSRRSFICNSSLVAAVGLQIAPGFSSAAPVAEQPSTALSLSIAESFVPSVWLRAMSAVAANAAADAAFWSAFQVAGWQWQRQRLMRSNTLTLLSLPAPGVEPFATDVAMALADESNAQLAELVRASTGQLAGLATVSAFDGKAAQQAERAIAQGLSGISLGANRGMPLDHRSLWPLYEFAAQARVPVYLPAAYAPATHDVPYRAMNRAGVITGPAADSAQHARQLIFGGVLDAFPTLKVVMARMGEGLPFWYGHLTDLHDSLVQAGQAPQRSVEAYFANNLLLTTADMSAATLQFCSVMFAAQRLLISQGSLDEPAQRIASRVGLVPRDALWS